jgi:hypothetical protein
MRRFIPVRRAFFSSPKGGATKKTPMEINGRNLSMQRINASRKAAAH